MESPITAVEDLIASEIAKVKAWAAGEIQRVKIEGKIEILQLIDWAGQDASSAAHRSVQGQIADLKAELAKIDNAT